MNGPQNPAIDARISGALKTIRWYGHDAFRVDGKTATVYFDPWQLPAGAPKGDIILVSHDHHDHCSPEDIRAVSTETTVVVTVAAAASGITGTVKTVKPGDTLTVHGVRISVVAAYNVNKFRSPGNPFHPKQSGHAGFIVEVDGVRIYHTGDSDFTPEMAAVKTDIALLPVSGTYVMTVEEAAKAADAMKPAAIVPMHVGRGIGSMDDREKLKKLTVVPVVILPMEIR